MRTQPKKWCVFLSVRVCGFGASSGLWIEGPPEIGMETIGSDKPLTRYSALEDDGESILLWLTTAEAREFNSLWWGDQSDE